MKERVYIELDYRELKSLIKDTFPEMIRELNLPYEFEWNNDTAQTATGVNGFVDHLHDAGFAHFIEQEGYFNLHELLQRLCFAGAIPSGDYIVTISW